jgi:Methyltransferase FkbM domain
MDEFCQALVPTANSDLILQMDIEGAEYSVLQSMSENLLKRFRIMVIEYHNLEQILSRFGFEILRNTLVKMQTYHEVVHIHLNNCGGIVQFGELKVPRIAEFTYYRRDQALFDKDTILTFPHPLDVDNVPTKAHITLPACLRISTAASV